MDGFWDAALGQEYRVVIIERQQATIEHPVDCATQGQTVSYRVWSRAATGRICAACTSDRPPPLRILSPVTAQVFDRRTSQRPRRRHLGKAVRSRARQEDG